MCSLLRIPQSPTRIPRYAVRKILVNKFLLAPKTNALVPKTKLACAFPPLLNPKKFKDIVGYEVGLQVTMPPVGPFVEVEGLCVRFICPTIISK
jgi:hypothetical protein